LVALQRADVATVISRPPPAYVNVKIKEELYENVIK